MPTNSVNEKLFAPLEYWYATPDQIESVVNGCGGRASSHIPDNLLGLEITEACNIHDWMYTFDREERKKSDKFLLQNLRVLNRHSDSSEIVKLLRKPLLTIYYLGVRLFGGSHFKRVPEAKLISNVITH